MLERAARLLGPVLEDLVFVGGCATGLLITDVAAGKVRPTFDVDAIVEISSYSEYATFSERLRELGLHEDVREGAPICRWRYEDLTIDVMPIDESILGFSNRWYEEAHKTAQRTELASDLSIDVITAPYFIASKFEAFRGRGKGDFFGSHDLEDLIAVVDGRDRLADEVRESSTQLREYIRVETKRLLEDRAFMDALPGLLPQTMPVSKDFLFYLADYVPYQNRQFRRPASVDEILTI
jgi:hypothetical protein